MMKTTTRWCQTPPSVTVRIKPNTAHIRQIKRGMQFKRLKVQDAQGPPRKIQPNWHRLEFYNSKFTSGLKLVIHREEMVAFFRLFDDDFVQEFLWMDCCCKISDKYLLAMTFIYFKRANFCISDHNRMNFFIALYLANTMEEDEEENKYEIFPWALGKRWRNHFRGFLEQRDKLWARIGYRAAVSRRCCEEVMAIIPSHFVWQRERAEHHSGARRHYTEQDQLCVPRGPSASPVPCALCNHSIRRRQSLNLSSSSSGFLELTPSPTFQLSVATSRAKVSRRKAGKTQREAQHLSCHCTEEFPRKESACGSTYDSSMDWIDEE
ncbi:speedy protein A [Lampris incognitus]|uniref:speedy protein A n=1 Tax=Lampris incognitus TaxID=2546036 RepID=UPI0024B5224D|nr:speedy protein A [Lampris incognitus]